MGLELARGRIWVADSCKGRRIGFSLPVTANGPDEEMVIGKLPPPSPRPYWTWPANTTGTNQEEGLRIPWRLATDGRRLHVSDHALHRVLVLDTDAGEGTHRSPAEPLFVLGQSNKKGTGVNRHTLVDGEAVFTPAAWSLFLPCALACDGTRLVLADSGSHRVRVFLRQDRTAVRQTVRKCLCCQRRRRAR